MSDLFEKVPDIRVALKLKILDQIRTEVGHDEPIQQHHEVQTGVNVPSRAETYEEWVEQNRMAVWSTSG